MKTLLFSLGFSLLASFGTQAQLAFSATPITLNGYPIDFNLFSLSSRGVLAVVEGDPRSSKHKPILFRAYIRRAGRPIRQGASNDVREVFSVQLQDLLLLAKYGDELIIDPVRAEHYPARRVVSLRPFSWIVFKRLDDGC